MIKKTLFGTAKRSFITVVSSLTVITIGILGVIAYNKMQHDDTVTVYSSSRSGDTPTSSSTSSSTEIDENQQYYREALATLEKSDTPVEDTNQVNAVKNAVQTAQEAMNALDKIADATGTFDNKLSATTTEMVLTFAIICKTNNYKMETVDVFESDSADVLQFVITMTNETGKNCYIAGNYNKYAGLLQLASYHGGEVGATYG